MLSTETVYSAVNFVPTFTGRAVYPRSPEPQPFSIIDISHHLANVCRYTGAVDPFYSTGQHCCLLFDYVKNVRKGTPLDCLQILMHDAAEAYLNDLARPIKQHLPDYRKWDHDLTMQIRAWMGWRDIPIPAWQDELDSRIIVDEKTALMRHSVQHCADWKHDLEPLGIDIREAWNPKMTDQQFLMRYGESAFQSTGEHQYLRAGWGVPTHSIYTPDWRTQSSDMIGNTERHAITDLIEVDVRGGVGRVVIRREDGMMLRDREAGRYPMPAWEFVHGDFKLIGQGKDHGLGS